jgi:formate hydrogenlyase subunit 4
MTLFIGSWWVMLLQGLGLMAIAPLFLGILNWFRMMFTMRPRPLSAVLFPYWDLWQTVRRPAVRAKVGSWWFALTPAVLLATYGALAFAIPLFTTFPLFAADLILVMYLLGLARFALSLAGLDSVTPFGWLGASREMFFQFLTEINFVLLIAALALLHMPSTFEIPSLAGGLPGWQLTDALSLTGLIRAHMQSGWSIYSDPVYFLLAVALWIILLFEAGRIPIGNAYTHLELTMGAEAVTINYGGSDLAIIKYAEILKLSFFLMLFIGLFIPVGNFHQLTLAVGTSPRWFETVPAEILWFALKIVLLLLSLAFWENTRPKRRLRTVTQPAVISMVLIVVAVVYIIFKR